MASGKVGMWHLICEIVVVDLVHVAAPVGGDGAALGIVAVFDDAQDNAEMGPAVGRHPCQGPQLDSAAQVSLVGEMTDGEQIGAQWMAVSH